MCVPAPSNPWLPWSHRARVALLAVLPSATEALPGAWGARADGCAAWLAKVGEVGAWGGEPEECCDGDAR